MAFYWHFARQAKPLFAALFVAGFIVAIMDTMIPIFIGRIVTLVTSANPQTLFAEHGLEAHVSRSFGEEELPEGLVTILGRRPGSPS